MNQINAWWLIAVTTLVGTAVGALLCLYLTHRAAHKRKMIPKRWPLNPRVLANTQERKVWRWLSQTFLDHHIMIKIPVIRFTMPRTKEQGLYWYKLLSGVYCTFTVCRSDGRVVGCVDVLGPRGLSRSNRHLKQTLLLQCGISYWVLEPENLPAAEEIRTEFLGEAAASARPPERQHDRDGAMINAARQSLSAALNRQRRSRNSGPAPLLSGSGPISTGAAGSQRPADSSFAGSSGFGSGWQQQNSFLTPLDSRRAELR
jgi:hypothetical protein